MSRLSSAANTWTKLRRVPGGNDMLNQAFAEVMMEGDCEERVFTFPIPTYNITKDFDWSNPIMIKSGR
jgi:hypothetical protein